MSLHPWFYVTRDLRSGTKICCCCWVNFNGNKTSSVKVKWPKATKKKGWNYGWPGTFAGVAGQLPRNMNGRSFSNVKCDIDEFYLWFVILIPLTTFMQREMFYRVAIKWTTKLSQQSSRSSNFHVPGVATTTQKAHAHAHRLATATTTTKWQNYGGCAGQRN